MLSPQEQEFRMAWARYFAKRALKSQANAQKYPQHAQTWMDKANGEWECAWVLQCGDTLDDLTAALDKTGPP